MTFPGRIWRVLRLDASVYREVAGDGAATRQAVLIYVFPGLAAGLAGFFNPAEAAPLTRFGFAVLWAPAGLMLLTTSQMWSARRVLGRRAGYGGMFRALGFASVPIMVATAIATNPSFVEFGVDLAILGIGFLWFVAGAILAIKAVYECTTGQAIRTLLAAQRFYVAIWWRTFRRLRIRLGARSEPAEPDESFAERRVANRNRYRQPKGRDRFRR
jgi:hypothetical protein